MKRKITCLRTALAIIVLCCGAFETTAAALGALPERVRDALPEGVREVLAPVTVQAAENDPAMSQGASVLQAGANTNSAQTVYYAGKPWRVIAYGTEGNTAAGASGALTLFSADNLTTSQFNLNGAGDRNNYATNPDDTGQTSMLKTAVDNLFNGTGVIFSEKERAAVNKRTLENDEYKNVQPYSNGVSGNPTSGYLWPLSTAEALSLPDMFRAANNYWWLRSPGDNVFTAARVLDDGYVDRNGRSVHYAYGVRPAFYLNLNSVLFSSAAAGGKSSGGLGTLGKVETMGTVSGAPNEWKLTLKDDGSVISTLNGHDGFTASRSDGTGDVQAGNQITIDYSGAQTGANEYVSVILKDSSGNILYYGNLANTDGGSASATNVPLTIPADVPAGSYTLGVFAEQCNPGTATDYASAVADIDITVTAPVAPNVTVTPASLDFENKPEGYAAITPKPVTVKNEGGGVATVSNVTVSDPAAYELSFMQGGTPVTLPGTVSLAAGNDLWIGVSPKDGLAPGSYNATMTIAYHDGADKTKRVSLAFTVAEAPVVPSITTTTLPSGKVGDAYTAPLSATGTAPFTWSATGLPAGLSVNSSTGAISGTPTAAGTFTVTVTAENSAGSDTKTFTLTIDPASAPVPAPPAQTRHELTLSEMAGATTDPTPGTYHIIPGYNFKFRLTPQSGYAFEGRPTVTTGMANYDGRIEYTPVVVGGKVVAYDIRLTDICRPFTLSLAGGISPVANEGVGGTRAWANAGTLYIRIAGETAHVQVFNLAGTLVADKRAPTGQSIITGLPCGAYIVRIGNRATKVSVK